MFSIADANIIMTLTRYFHNKYDCKGRYGTLWGLQAVWLQSFTMIPRYGCHRRLFESDYVLSKYLTVLSSVSRCLTTSARGPICMPSHPAC